jgi:membrane associated rhomboid family serine protease
MTPIVGLVVVMWGVELSDGLLLADHLQRHGIGPRRIDGLEGVLFAPLLHSTFGHLASNTVPFAVLGWFTALRGTRFWLTVTAWVWLGGGGLVWLAACGSNHIGASGLVFGYFGALLGAAIRSRHPATLAPALVAIFLYGTILAGLVPQDDLSWEGHLAGLVVGLVVAYRGTDPPPPPPPDDEIAYPWEIDEPWRVDEE